MAANADIYFEHDRWGRALAWSAGLHVGITAFVLILSMVLSARTGDTWGAGGGGEAIGATLVSTVPLSVAPSQTQNVLANESKGLTQSQPKIEEKAPDAIEIQGKNAKIKPKKKQETVSKEKPQPAPEEENNQVAFGEGGPVSGPYGTFSAGGAKGGFGITGGGGDFGTKYAWYVHVIQQKVAENWLKYEVDPRITSAERVYITFDVMRDGHPTNVQIEQSSNVPSLDNSAKYALQRIDTFGPLPSDYSGGKISVEYWFDYKK
ncbi:MAG: TonB family protein [Candidatus Sulfotelmatobacter sp.]